MDLVAPDRLFGFDSMPFVCVCVCVSTILTTPGQQKHETRKGNDYFKVNTNHIFVSNSKVIGGGAES